MALFEAAQCGIVTELHSKRALIDWLTYISEVISTDMSRGETLAELVASGTESSGVSAGLTQPPKCLGDGAKDCGIVGLTLVVLSGLTLVVLS